MFSNFIFIIVKLLKACIFIIVTIKHGRDLAFPLPVKHCSIAYLGDKEGDYNDYNYFLIVMNNAFNAT